MTVDRLDDTSKLFLKSTLLPPMTSHDLESAPISITARVDDLLEKLRSLLHSTIDNTKRDYEAAMQTQKAAYDRQKKARDRMGMKQTLKIFAGAFGIASAFFGPKTTTARLLSGISNTISPIQDVLVNFSQQELEMIQNTLEQNRLLIQQQYPNLDREVREGDQIMRNAIEEARRRINDSASKPFQGSY